MLEISLNLRQHPAAQILCLGAHSDDIEIGCGGTILKLIGQYPNLRVYWVVLGATDQRAKEAFDSANCFLSAIKDKQIQIKGFRDGFFPYVGADIKAYFEELKAAVLPSLIFTHARHDLHQDHRLISELTWNTFRDHLILEYEIPKYDGDLGQPNLYVSLSEAICAQKVRHLGEHFRTQTNKDWFSDDTFQALMRLRGVESRAPHRFAEAFYCRKLVLE
jgi:LmbE family N-acetylglucosaminyl deacetylase